MLPRVDILHEKEQPMSPTTRNAFVILTIVYCIYQFSTDHATLGLIGIVFAALILWLGKRR
jgi:hypothetical protein